MHYNFHVVGVSTNGTSYVANRQQPEATPPGGTVYFDIRIVRISEGSGPNARITIVGSPGNFVTTVTCVG